jgi:uncharacterized protein (TIGR02117 family)
MLPGSDAILDILGWNGAVCRGRARVLACCAPPTTAQASMSKKGHHKPGTDAKKRKGPIRRFLKWPLRFVLGFVSLLLLYFVSAIVLGLIPTNADWKQVENGRRVYVITNGVHTSFILPTGDGGENLLAFAPFEKATRANTPYIEFGWGDRGFYLETPQWSDLTVGTALNAVFLPSSTVVHVDYWEWEPPVKEHIRRITLDDEEYGRLLDYIRKSFALDAQKKVQRIPDAGYHERDAFFQGQGSYSLLYTCNDWTNAGLKHAGVKTALWSPFDKAILYHLPVTKDG